MVLKEITATENDITSKKPKRKVGRPRKHKELIEPVKTVLPVDESASVEQPKRKVGRPRKSESSVELVNNELPLTLGVLLRQARHQKHMKLSSVAKKLCIKEVYLEALEQGHYYAFPALVYGAGFLRAYATFLGLNADEMAVRFRRETTDIPPEALNMPRESNSAIIPSPKTILKSLLVLFVLYLVWNVYKIMTNQPAPELQMPVVVQTTHMEDQVNVTAPVAADEISQETVVQESQAGKDQKVRSDKKEMPPVPVSRRVGISYGLKTPARVSFLATDTVQIEVRDTEADSTLFQKTLEAGDRYNPVDGVEGLVLRTTNAGGLDVYVDGKKVKTLGKKGQIKAGVPMDALTLLKD